MRTSILIACSHSLKFLTAGMLLFPWVDASRPVACLVLATARVTSHCLPKLMQLLYCRGPGHRAFDMTRKVVLAILMASPGGRNCGVENVALLFDALPGTLKLWAIFEAVLVRAALFSAHLHLLPSGPLGQVLFKQAIDHLLD